MSGGFKRFKKPLTTWTIFLAFSSFLKKNPSYIWPVTCRQYLNGKVWCNYLQLQPETLETKSRSDELRTVCSDEGQTVLVSRNRGAWNFQLATGKKESAEQEFAGTDVKNVWSASYERHCCRKTCDPLLNSCGKPNAEVYQMVARARSVDHAGRMEIRRVFLKSVYSFADSLWVVLRRYYVATVA